MFPHRTETMDYSMVLSGEIDVEFDSGQVVTMKPGDIIIMRGVTPVTSPLLPRFTVRGDKTASIGKRYPDRAIYVAAIFPRRVLAANT
jgi:hypothetical protein